MLYGTVGTVHANNKEKLGYEIELKVDRKKVLIKPENLKISQGPIN